jgi:hypothetical protein
MPPPFQTSIISAPRIRAIIAKITPRGTLFSSSITGLQQGSLPIITSAKGRSIIKNETSRIASAVNTEAPTVSGTPPLFIKTSRIAVPPTPPGVAATPNSAARPATRLWNRVILYPIALVRTHSLVPLQNQDPQTSRKRTGKSSSGKRFSSWAVSGEIV